MMDKVGLSIYTPSIHLQPRVKQSFSLYVVVLLLTLKGCTSSEDEKLADERNTGEWLSYGRTHSEQRFSPLADVDTNSVYRL